MNPHKKRLYKRLAKWLSILSYVLLGMGIIIPMIFTPSESNYCTIILVFLGLICASVISMFTGLIYSALIKNYKFAIERYIEHKMFLKIMDLLDNGDLKTAICYYSSSIHAGNVQDFLWGYILALCQLSNDPTLKSDAASIIDPLKATTNLDKLLAKFK